MPPGAFSKERELKGNVLPSRMQRDRVRGRDRE